MSTRALAADVVPSMEAAGATPSSADPGWPYVYTEWEHYTTKDGLPNDHVFAVKAAGPYVWIGTEGGLARLDQRTGEIRSWTEADGLPWRVVSALDVHPETGEVWIGLFGGGLARYSGGRFDHWHQLNSGLVNDVVYGVAIENDNVWAATTAGASRYNTVTGEWSIFTEKNAPMEEIWNYGVCYADGLVHLGVWGSGVLEYDIARDAWKDYLDPDGEMEIDLYRDDGIVHVITTGVSHVDRVLWVTTYFGACRYDRRHWRGLFAHECGLPSDFNNSVKGRSAHEAWFATDKGLGVLADFETDTWVTYTSDQAAGTGQAVIQRGEEVLATVDTGVNLPHNYALWVDLAGDDAWVGTSKGLAHAVGTGYYPRLRPGPAPVGRAAQSTKADPPEPAPTAEPDQRRLLEHIDVGPYDVPGLSLRKDSNYAHSATDVEPFRHVTPFKEHFLEQMEYTGPGRAVAEPADLDSVKLGFIGPIMPTVSVATGGKSHAERLGIAMLRGAQLAVEQANARGGYRARGIPFELVISNDNGLWGASGNEIIKLAYRDKVWAILGTIDGANSHIAIRVALKAEIAMMNTGDTDPTFIETNIPWVLRCIGDDRQMGYLLVDHLYRKLGYTRVGIIRASNRYGRFGVREIKDGSRRLGHPVIIEMAYQVGAEDYGLQIDRLARSDLQAIVHWGDARDGALILRQLRDRGLDQPFFACDRCVSEEFLELAGDYAEGVTCGYPWNPADPGPGFAAFRDAYVEHYNAEPGTYAAHAYDGMNLLIDAVQRAGLNRAKMRDVLAHRAEPYPGVTGEIPFSACLDDLGEVFLARVEGGQWRYHSRAELDIPQGPIAPRDRASRKTAVLPSAAPPHVDFRAHEPSYAGPVPAVGTNEPAGASVGAAPASPVRVAWFGPDDPADPQAGTMWAGATLAVEEANARRGNGEPRVVLEPIWSGSPWGTGVAAVAKRVYDGDVRAVVGAPDGSSAHLLAQVAAKARVAVVSPVASDATSHAANVPWLFSLTPSDDAQADALADTVQRAIEARDAAGLVVISSTEHDARLFTAALVSACHHRGIHPARHVTLAGDAPAFDAASEAVAAQPRAVVAVIASAELAGRCVRAVRDQADPPLLIGGPALATPAFIATAGATGEGVRVPLTWHAEQSEAARAFARRFEQRFGYSADQRAATSYDAVQVLLAAGVARALPRESLAAALRAQAGYVGVSGPIVWAPNGQAERPVGVATWRDGVLVGE